MVGLAAKHPKIATSYHNSRGKDTSGCKQDEVLGDKTSPGWAKCSGHKVWGGSPDPGAGVL